MKRHFRAIAFAMLAIASGASGSDAAPFAAGTGFAVPSDAETIGPPPATTTATALPVPAPKDFAPPTATPTPTSAPTPVPGRKERGKRNAPSPSPTVTPSPTPTESPTFAPTISPTAPPTPVSPAPLPSAKPSFVPSAPAQPTIPDSIDDPSVRAAGSRPIPELSQIGWIAGTWNARSVEERSDGTKQSRGITTYVFATTMKGRYYFGADSKSRDYIYVTFDPLAKRWVLLRFASNPSYGIWLSEVGWEGNRIEFLSRFSSAIGRQYNRRTTIVHKNSRAFDISDEEQQADGTWLRDSSVEFNKQQ